MSVKDGTFESKTSGKTVSRVLTPTKKTHPEDVIKDVCRCTSEIRVGTIEVIYFGRCMHVDITPDTMSEDVRRTLRPMLDQARETYLNAERIYATVFA